MNNDYFFHWNFPSIPLLKLFKNSNRMKKIYLALVLCLTSIASTKAQGATTFNMDSEGMSVNSSNVPQSQKIGEATMEFSYNYHFKTDTTDSSKVKKDLMILQVSDKLTKFFSYRKMQIDSLIQNASTEEILSNPSKFAGGEAFSVYKNFVEGKLTSVDRIALDWFRVDEEIPQFDWKLKNETKEILGYQCRKAECKFRGRYWEVWYTEQIPLPIGPWKFGGLPGIIIEATDKQGHYSFVMVGVNPKADRIITIPDTKYNNTTLKKYYKALRLYKSNPIASLQASGVNLTINNPDGTPKDPSELIKELKYNFIER